MLLYIGWSICILIKNNKKEHGNGRNKNKGS